MVENTIATTTSSKNNLDLKVDTAFSETINLEDYIVDYDILQYAQAYTILIDDGGTDYLTYAINKRIITVSGTPTKDHANGWETVTITQDDSF